MIILGEIVGKVRSIQVCPSLRNNLRTDGPMAKNTFSIDTNSSGYVEKLILLSIFYMSQHKTK